MCRTTTAISAVSALALPFTALLFLMTRRPPTTTLFPYTTLFRSCAKESDIRGLVIEFFAYFPEQRNLDTLTLFEDRKSTRLNSSHTVISYAVFCLKKKNSTQRSAD